MSMQPTDYDSAPPSFPEVLCRVFAAVFKTCLMLGVLTLFVSPVSNLLGQNVTIPIYGLAALVAVVAAGSKHGLFDYSAQDGLLDRQNMTTIVSVILAAFPSLLMATMVGALLAPSAILFVPSFFGFMFMFAASSASMGRPLTALAAGLTDAGLVGLAFYFNFIH